MIDLMRACAQVEAVEAVELADVLESTDAGAVVEGAGDGDAPGSRFSDVQERCGGGELGHDRLGRKVACSGARNVLQHTGNGVDDADQSRR